MDEVDDAGPGVTLGLAPQAGAAGGDAGIGAGAGHLGHHQRRPAQGTRAQVDQVEVAGHPVNAGILGHRRDHDAVFEGQATQCEGGGEGRRDALRQRRQPGAGGDPGFEPGDVARVAQAQVLVADALAAGQQRVGKLLGRQSGVARHVLEPLGRIARGVLDFQHLDAARGLETGQRGAQSRLTRRGIGQRLVQRDRVFQREFGARADREMGGVGGVADQHDGPGPIRTVRPVRPMHPMRADHAWKANPLRRAAQVRRIADQFVPAQHACEELFAKGDGFVLVHPVQPVGQPDRLGRLDDEGAHLLVKAVGMGLEPAARCFLKVEGEGVKTLGCAEPDKAAGAQINVGLVDMRILLPDAAVQAVAGDHQVGVQQFVVRRVGGKAQIDAQFGTARLQDVEQAQPADAAKAVAARDDALIADMHRHVVPVVERGMDLRRAGRIGLAQRVQRLVRKDHAPAKGVVGAVALVEPDLARWVALLGQQGEIQAGGAAAQASDAHRVIRSRSAAKCGGRRRTLELNNSVVN